MPISMKKRYPRAVRFRRIASNNNALQQTRRDPLADPDDNNIVVAGSNIQLTCNKAVIVPSNAAAVTGITNSLGAAPTAITVGAVNEIIFHFAAGTPTALIVPFEDPAARGQVGEYLLAGTYITGG